MRKTEDYCVTFAVRGSFLSIDDFVAWTHRQLGPKIEDLYIEFGQKEWQANRRCDCGFVVRGSFLSIDDFVAWVHRQLGPKIEHLCIAFGQKEWQANRRCDCGSHVFEAGSSISKVKCFQCGKEFEIQ